MVAAAPPLVVPAKVEEPMQQSPQSEDEDGDRAGGQSDIQPVGHDYVEEVGRIPEQHFQFKFDFSLWLFTFRE